MPNTPNMAHRSACTVSNRQARQNSSPNTAAVRPSSSHTDWAARPSSPSRLRFPGDKQRYCTRTAVSQLKSMRLHTSPTVHEALCVALEFLIIDSLPATGAAAPASSCCLAYTTFSREMQVPSGPPTGAHSDAGKQNLGGAVGDGFDCCAWQGELYGRRKVVQAERSRPLPTYTPCFTRHRCQL